jgi:hypothetical protein
LINPFLECRKRATADLLGDWNVVPTRGRSLILTRLLLLSSVGGRTRARDALLDFERYVVGLIPPNGNPVPDEILTEMVRLQETQVPVVILLVVRIIEDNLLRRKMSEDSGPDVTMERLTAIPRR